MYLPQCGYSVVNFPRQRGKGLGSLFRSFLKLARPLVKTGIKMARPHVKRLAKRALKEGVKTLSHVSQDVIAGDDVKSSIKRRGSQSLSNFLDKTRPTNNSPPVKRRKKTVSRKKKKKIVGKTGRVLF